MDKMQLESWKLQLLNPSLTFSPWLPSHTISLRIWYILSFLQSCLPFYLVKSNLNFRHHMTGYFPICISFNMVSLIHFQSYFTNELLHLYSIPPISTYYVYFGFNVCKDIYLAYKSYLLHNINAFDYRTLILFQKFGKKVVVKMIKKSAKLI